MKKQHHALLIVLLTLLLFAAFNPVYNWTSAHYPPYPMIVWTNLYPLLMGVALALPAGKPPEGEKRISLSLPYLLAFLVLLAVFAVLYIWYIGLVARSSITLIMFKMTIVYCAVKAFVR